jgi:hypothetical protein
MELKNPRIVTDNKGNQYKIKGGARIRGEITASYNLSYSEQNGIVTNFKSLRVVNYLVVQNLKIPLQEDDHVITVKSESESLIDRLFGGFF